MDKKKLLILIAPNVSEQMGGEGIKALQIFQEYKKIYPNTVQITHSRNRSEVRRLQLEDVYFVEESFLSVLLWRSVIFRLFLNVLFSRQAVHLAETIALQQGFQSKESVIIHQTEPNSPVAPRSMSKSFLNVFGPINGNIYYPEIFRNNEKALVKLRRLMHFKLQRLNAFFQTGLQSADMIFVAGGKRTLDSLKVAGCKVETLVETLDCGIRDTFFSDWSRVEHSGANYKYIHFGRLVFHKGTMLIIKSLAKTKNDIYLDIIGKGPELENYKKLTKELGLEKRVKFLGWHAEHNDLFASFKNYRGMVLPSIEDANGIVVQEAMALGLPCICLNWGGPQLLIDHEVNGYLIDPLNEEYITEKIAGYMDKLSTDGDLAESYSLSARKKAESWRWSEVAKEWLSHYKC